MLLLSERTPFEDAPYQFLSNSGHSEFLTPTRAPGAHPPIILVGRPPIGFLATVAIL